jgi:peptide-methionine (S)-S-oxide reductase
MTHQRAILAGGCFWGMEDLFRKLNGVIDTTVGYTGGTFPNPTYEDIKNKDTGHAEALEIIFDDAVLSYRALLEFFFKIHDPTTKNRQGNDVGASYRSAIFYTDATQQQTAIDLIVALDASKKWPKKIVTEVVPLVEFYTAEGYHQDYLVRYPNGYTCHFIRPEWTLV